MLQLVLSLFKVYLPMLLGTIYVLGYERKKLDNLLKFFVISVQLSLIQTLIQSSTQTWTVSAVLIPIYAYLTLFSYSYSGTVYDVIFAPLAGIILESFELICRNVEKERIKAKIYSEDSNVKLKSQQGYLNGIIADTFKPETILLLS